MTYDPAYITVERAISECRAGRPVLIRDKQSPSSRQVMVTSAETITSEIIELLNACTAQSPKLVVSAARLRRMGVVNQTSPASITLDSLDIATIERLAFHVDARLDHSLNAIGPFEMAALTLAQLAHVLPALVMIDVDSVLSSLPDAIQDMMVTTTDDVERYPGLQTRNLTLISRAPVPLEGAGQTEFVIFRGGEGLRDQAAIIVGTPDIDAPVLTRLHSACLTGDLFGSLKCDCGDQLRGTVRFMASNGGGILLYLDQEGRGNGLSNKMRAYALQAKGWDTYDADEVLGFDLDQRRFDFAANMLTQLGISRVRLMTNNPVKIAALQAAGLEVMADQRILGRLNSENVQYLTSKRERAGHLIDAEYLASAPARVSVCSTPL